MGLGFKVGDAHVPRAIDPKDDDKPIDASVEETDGIDSDSCIQKWEDAVDADSDWKYTCLYHTIS